MYNGRASVLFIYPKGGAKTMLNDRDRIKRETYPEGMWIRLDVQQELNKHTVLLEIGKGNFIFPIPFSLRTWDTRNEAEQDAIAWTDSLRTFFHELPVLRNV